MSENKKKDNKKKLKFTIVSVCVVIMFVVIGIAGIYDIFVGDETDKYSRLPDNMFALNKMQDDHSEKKKSEVYSLKITDQKKDFDLSFELDTVNKEKKEDAFPLKLGDNAPEHIEKALEDKAISETPPQPSPRRSPVSTKRTAPVAPRQQAPVIAETSVDNQDDLFGKTISFSDAKTDAPVGFINACINKGGQIRQGDIIQVRLLEKYRDLPKNTVLIATCQISNSRLKLHFNNMNMKAYDLDGLEGLSIADSKIKQGADILTSQARTSLESTASAVNSQLGTGVRLIGRVFNANKSGQSDAIEVPTAYAIYLKPF